MKVALLADIAPYGMKGLKNYVITKAQYLKKKESSDFKVDFYIVKILPPRLLSWLFKIDLSKDTCYGAKSIELEGTVFNLIFIRRSLFDLFYEKLTKKETTYSRQTKKLAKSFKDYDIITTHSRAAHLLALSIKKNYRIPFVTTWHGTDIHTAPLNNPALKVVTALIIKEAAINLFVSKALLKTSELITKDGKKEHIYTGVSDRFYEYGPDKKLELRKINGVEGKKVVAFSGNLYPVKNPLVLPEIFEKVSAGYSDKVIFWIMGDGMLREQLKERLDKTKIEYKMFGNINPVDMPDRINCLDVLVLPSLNEGLPLSLIEARRCGVVGVGSRQGGIAEAVGEENAFPLDSSFVDNISSRIIAILEKNERPMPLSEEFSWESAIDKELNLYNEILIKD